MADNPTSHGFITCPIELLKENKAKKSVKISSINSQELQKIKSSINSHLHIQEADVH